MDEVSVRELRNHGGRVLDRVTTGESLVVTKSGEPVAELRPIVRATPLTVLLDRWRRLPPVDPDQLRADLDAVIDQSL